MRVMETQISEIEKKEGYGKQISTHLLKSFKKRHNLLSAPELHVIVRAESSLLKRVQMDPLQRLENS